MTVEEADDQRQDHRQANENQQAEGIRRDKEVGGKPLAVRDVESRPRRASTAASSGRAMAIGIASMGIVIAEGKRAGGTIPPAGDGAGMRTAAPSHIIGAPL